MLPTLRKSGQRAFGTTAASIKYAPPTLESVGKSSFPNLRMVLLGAPGSGKGSFAKFISHYYNVPVLSTGDLIRKEIADNSPIGRAVKEASNSGKLLGDDVVIEVLKNALSKATSSSPSGTPPNGYILDGFPRRISQAVSLEQMNGAVNAASGTAASAAASSSASAHAQGGASLPPINVALNINLREDVLVRKAVARRVCKGCGRGYNVADIQEDNICMPAILPRRTGVCDSCDSELISRVDDTEATVRKRLAEYHAESKPLETFYRDRGLLVEWPVQRGLEDTAALLATVDAHLAAITTKRENHSTPKWNPVAQA